MPVRTWTCAIGSAGGSGFSSPISLSRSSSRFLICCSLEYVVETSIM